MIGVEQSSHRIEQVLVLVEVLLCADRVKLELRANVRVFESLVVPNVIHEARQHFV